jgi:uncharacterized YigZ family protein
MEIDTYHTIAQPTEGIYKDKGSKFLSFAFPVSSEIQAKVKITELKKKYFDARHHCYAYLLGANETKFRINDDGEPSGTAGKPIFGQIRSKNVTNVLILVVRYFGGTLLGTSGLIKAYKTAASLALENATIIEKTIQQNYTITFPYETLPEIKKILKEEGANILDQHFDASCRIAFSCRISATDLLENKIKIMNQHGNLNLIKE